MTVTWRRPIRLIQNGRTQFSVRDPDIALFVLTRKRITQFDVLRGYVNILMERGAAREKAGDAAQAIASYSQVLQFSERMLVGHELPPSNILRRVRAKRPVKSCKNFTSRLVATTKRLLSRSSLPSGKPGAMQT